MHARCGLSTTWVDEFGGFCTKRLRQALSDRFFSILRGDLARSIYDTVGAGMESVFGDSIRALDQDQNGVSVEFDHSSSRRFDLVVGADGLHSAVRTLVFGPKPSFETYLGYCVASFAVNSYPHRNESVYVAYCRPGKQVARFTLRDGRTVFFVIFAARDKPDVAHHDTDAQKGMLHRILGDMGWECPEILRALDSADELYFDLSLRFDCPNGTTAASPWLATPPFARPCWPARVPPLPWPAPTSWQAS